MKIITCDCCGKTTGEGDIGAHWICDSCKVPEPQTKDASAASDSNSKPAKE